MVFTNSCYSKSKVIVAMIYINSKKQMLRDIRQSCHSQIDNCGLFIRHQEYKSQVTSYKINTGNAAIH